MLFTPFQLGSHTLKNRLVALPVFSGYARPDGRASDLLIEHDAILDERQLVIREFGDLE